MILSISYFHFYLTVFNNIYPIKRKNIVSRLILLFAVWILKRFAEKTQLGFAEQAQLGFEAPQAQLGFTAKQAQIRIEK